MIDDFNFDLDKDGHVDPFELKVLAALKAADTAGSGTLTTAQFVKVLRGVAATEKDIDVAFFLDLWRSISSRVSGTYRPSPLGPGVMPCHKGTMYIGM